MPRPTSSGGPAPVELDMSSVVRTGAILAETLSPNTSYFAEPTAGAIFTLPLISTIPAGAQILIRNNSDETISVTPSGTDNMEDAAVPLEMAAGLTFRFLSKPLTDGITASWFTVTP